MPTFLYSWFRLATETGSNCGTSPFLCASSLTQPCHPGVWLIWHTQYKHVALDKAHFPGYSFAPRPKAIPEARSYSLHFGCIEWRQLSSISAWNASDLSQVATNKKACWKMNSTEFSLQKKNWNISQVSLRALSSASFSSHTQTQTCTHTHTNLHLAEMK